MSLLPEGATLSKSNPRKAGLWSRRPYRWLPRALLAVVVGLLTLKVADFAVGLLCGSQQRHLLRLAPNTAIRHRCREFDYEFRTNALGFRGPDIPFDKAPGTRRIVVLGDSFIAGYGVAEDDILTVRLQERLNGPGNADPARNADLPSADRPGVAARGADRVEVVNVGRVGTSTVRELDLYEAFGARYHPDLVILAYYFGNDLAEITQEWPREQLAQWHPHGFLRRAAYAWCPNVYLELAMLRQSRRQLQDFAPQSEVETIAQLRREAPARNVEPNLVEQRYHALPEWIRGAVAEGTFGQRRILDACLEPDRLVRALDPDDADFAPAWERTEVHLDRLDQAVRRDGARLAVVAIPAPFQVDPKSLQLHRELGFDVRDDWLTARKPRIAVALEQWAGRAGVPYLDLTPACRQTAGPLFFIEDEHFTPAGHTLAANEIARFLQEHRLLHPAAAP